MRGIAIVLTVILLASGCSRDNDEGATSPTTAPATATALFQRLEQEGTLGAFDASYIGKVAGGFLAVGVKGADQVAYFCDGTSGTWLAGPVGSELKAENGTTVQTTGSGDSLRATFRGSETVDLPKVDGDDYLVRFVSGTGTDDASVGGIIGHDGQAFGTINKISRPTIGTAVATTTTTPLRSQVIVRSPTLLLSVSLSVAPTQACQSLAISLRSLAAALGEKRGEKQALEQRLVFLADHIATLTAAGTDQRRTAIAVSERDQLRARLARVEVQIKALQQQMEDVRRRLSEPPCSGPAASEQELMNAITQNLNKAAESYAQLLSSTSLLN
jgi:hypothetical protein